MFDIGWLLRWPARGLVLALPVACCATGAGLGGGRERHLKVDSAERLVENHLDWLCTDSGSAGLIGISNFNEQSRQQQSAINADTAR